MPESHTLYSSNHSDAIISEGVSARDTVEAYYYGMHDGSNSVGALARHNRSLGQNEMESRRGNPAAQSPRI